MRRIGEIIDEIDLKGKNDELVKELVGLSTKHGILTPYTSFLADETATVRSWPTCGCIWSGRASRSIGCARRKGVAGFSQRSTNLTSRTRRTRRSFRSGLSRPCRAA